MQWMANELLEDVVTSKRNSSRSRDGSEGVERNARKRASSSKSYQVGPATDIYAYGVLMWEVLAQRKPWAGLDVNTIAKKVTSGERPSKDNVAYLKDDNRECTTFDSIVDDYGDLMNTCWHMRASERPTCDVVLRRMVELRDTCLDVRKRLRSSKNRRQSMFLKAMMPRNFWFTDSKGQTTRDGVGDFAGAAIQREDSPCSSSRGGGGRRGGSMLRGNSSRSRDGERGGKRSIELGNIRRLRLFNSSDTPKNRFRLSNSAPNLTMPKEMSNVGGSGRSHSRPSSKDVSTHGCTTTTSKEGEDEDAKSDEASSFRESGGPSPPPDTSFVASTSRGTEDGRSDTNRKGEYGGNNDNSGSERRRLETEAATVEGIRIIKAKGADGEVVTAPLPRRYDTGSFAPPPDISVPHSPPNRAIYSGGDILDGKDENLLSKIFR